MHENLKQQRDLADHLSVKVSDQQEEIVQLSKFHILYQLTVSSYSNITNITKNLVPVVQSIVSLTSWLRGQLVKCFPSL